MGGAAALFYFYWPFPLAVVFIASPQRWPQSLQSTAGHRPPSSRTPNQVGVCSSELQIQVEPRPRSYAGVSGEHEGLEVGEGISCPYNWICWLDSPTVLCPIGYHVSCPELCTSCSKGPGQSLRGAVFTLGSPAGPRRKRPRRGGEGMGDQRAGWASCGRAWWAAERNNACSGQREGPLTSRTRGLGRLNPRPC